MKRKASLLFLLAGVVFTAHSYAVLFRRSTYWIVFSQEPRPYVYRVLMPLFARALTWTGMSAESALTVSIVVSAVAFFLATVCLYETFFDDGRSWLVAFVASQFAFLFLFEFLHVYDLPTGAFFALSFALLARGRFKLYYVLFPLACLNRETTFLLILFFFIYYGGRMECRQFLHGLLYQVATWATIKVALQIIFADRPGVSASWNLLANLLHYIPQNPVGTLTQIAVFSLLVYIAIKAPSGFLRSAFLILFPVQFVLYLLLGGWGEVRVFVELYPVAFLLVAQSITLWQLQRTSKGLVYVG